MKTITARLALLLSCSVYAIVLDGNLATPRVTYELYSSNGAKPPQGDAEAVERLAAGLDLAGEPPPEGEGGTLDGIRVAWNEGGLYGEGIRGLPDEGLSEPPVHLYDHAGSGEADGWAAGGHGSGPSSSTRRGFNLAGSAVNGTGGSPWSSPGGVAPFISSSSGDKGVPRATEDYPPRQAGLPPKTEDHTSRSNDDVNSPIPTWPAAAPGSDLPVEPATDRLPRELPAPPTLLLVLAAAGGMWVNRRRGNKSTGQRMR